MEGVRAFKLIGFSVLMLLISGLLFIVASRPMFNFEPFDRAAVNDVLNYQLSALPVAALAVLATFAFAGRVLLRYLNLGRSGAMKTLTGKPGSGRWETDAWTISLMMIAVMGVVAFFQVLPNGFDFNWLYSLLIIPFAASNALVEELIFRLSYVSVGASVTRTAWYGLVMGSVVFGVFHYWGVVPNGLLGAAASMFLGYFLAKSIQETKGFFWAFTIHFMLDVVILFFVFNGA